MKQVPMEKVLRCSEVSGTACSFVAKGSMDEILAQAGKHAAEVHKLQVTPELVEAVKQAAREA